MKKPRIPPNLQDILARTDAVRLAKILTSILPASLSGEYLHWDQLIRYSPPAGLSHEEWWLGLKISRLYKYVPLLDKAGRPFRFLVPDSILEQLHQIDLSAGGRIGVPEPVTNPETRDQYYVSSLIEEAITSSQLEGATTTREVAKEMIRTARRPRDRSERMILNNYQTMQQIGKLKDNPLTPEAVFDLHRLVASETLREPSAAGRFRCPDGNVIIGDEYGAVFHVPPPVEELPSRMTAMCDFANGRTPDYFIHPVLRSIILHFWLAYDHPFVDGNGRTARALFYWSMLRYGFWLCEYLSISRIILKAPAKYYKVFLYTETDDNDLTYFLLHQMEVLRHALNDLHSYINARAEKLRVLERSLRGMALLNHRQRALISHALRHPGFRYTIEGHRRSHEVVYQTARTDLLDLKEKGLLNARKVGKTWYFTPASDMERKLADGML